MREGIVFCILAQMDNQLCLLDHKPFLTSKDAAQFQKKLIGNNPSLFSTIIGIQNNEDGSVNYFLPGEK